MKRYLYLLIKETTENRLSYRAIGMAAGIPAMSLSDYVLMGTEPRLKALVKLAAYFNEPIEALLLDQSEETPIDVAIYCHLKQLTLSQKEQLLDTIKNISQTP